MAKMKNVDYTILSIAQGEKRSTSLLQAGACVAMASYSREAFEHNVQAWLASIGLTLPAIEKKPRGRPANGAKVTKLPVVNKRAEKSVDRGTSKIVRDAKGAVTIALSAKRQSELVNTLVRGVVAWYSAQQQRDYSPCVAIVYSKRPQVSKGAKLAKEHNLHRDVLNRIAVATSRMYGMLKRMGITITLENQTARGKAGGRPPRVKPDADAADAKDNKLATLNAMAPREAFAYCIKHGVSEKALVKLAQYVIETRVAA